jgi:hypothetical protein
VGGLRSTPTRGFGSGAAAQPAATAAAPAAVVAKAAGKSVAVDLDGLVNFDDE